MTTSTYDNAFLSEKTYDKTLKKDDLVKVDIYGSPDYSVVETRSTDSGYQAVLFKNTTTGEYVFAGRGTESLMDAFADIQMGLAIQPQQFKDADAFYTEMATTYHLNKDNSTITGHSLDGAISQVLGAVYGIPTETFNAYGAGRFLTDFGLSEALNFSHISNHVTSLDIVSRLPDSQMIGTTYLNTNDKHYSQQTAA